MSKKQLEKLEDIIQSLEDDEIKALISVFAGVGIMACVYKILND